jgi:hypothetical protein
MHRIVREIHPEERQREGTAERRLSEFLTQPNIVLLGDPGAGKSHTFRELAAACGGRYLTARAFLTLPVRNTGEILFIDGLDERRGGRGDRDTVDALAAKLIEADPAAVRISCRVADWLGKSDLVSLEPFFEGRGGMVVLALEALTPGERRAVLTDNGMSQVEADALLREAEERGLAEFLDNPQNLLLLRRAVQSGAWPATRRDLFEMATRLMLQEENSERARTGSGVYTGEELRLPAGAALAARLISDIEAISLTDQEGTETIPSYRTLPFFEPGKTIAALGRRVFAAGPVPESVDYVHRTTAEYLGAAWLAQAVRAGLPIGRVVALIGVDGHPAPELRGLHAWLAVHLPEHAERLIDADAYGVLTYGDAASLSQTLCARLIRALGRLSRTDPWFRAGNYGSPAIAGFARADMVDEAHLAAVRTRLVSTDVSEGRLETMERRAARNAERTNDPDRLRREFARDAAPIASGAHLNGLIWAARVYLGIFNDVDRAAASEARFVPILGDAHAAMALDGLVAALDRTDVPSLQDVIDLAVQRQCMSSWHVYIAGLSERFRRTSSLEGVPDELLRAMLAFDLTNPVAESDEGTITWMQHPWKQVLLRERPELVRQAYEAVARAKLARGEQHPDGMRELLTHEALAALREDTVLGLLRDFPNANAFPLHELLMAALGMPSAHTTLLALADRVLSGTVTVDQPQRDLWLVTAWLLSSDPHGPALQATAQSRPEIVFDLRDFTGYSRDEAAPGPTPSLGQIEFLIRLAGSRYPPTGYPSGGWGGDRNAWDATDYVRGLINGLSAKATQAATDALSRLESDATLAAYRPEIQHALAVQRGRRREAEYDRPDWPRAVRALDNKQPATVADLDAILVEHLDDLRKRIRTENTDIYRMFWNLDGHGRLVSPRPEEACRDDLITLLRQRLAPLGISLEPEGHMAGDRRADISAAMPARKILCEIKRDYHPDVWTAPEGQLERFYAHDPEALGFGIYLVFWFGDDRPSAIPLPPDNQPRPTSAAEMEAMVRARLPADRAARTAVIVIDVTKPD